MDTYFKQCGLEKDFLAFARSQGVVARPGEWEESRVYLLPQIKGLCARYSKLGETAYYRYVLPLDETVQAAIKHGPVLELPSDEESLDIE